MNTTTLLRNVGVTTLIVLMAGCSQDKTDTALERPKPGPNDKIIIRGSNTFGEELGPRLIAAYKKDHPTADFDLIPKATGYGMASLIAGQCDIAGASRLPSVDEQELAKMRGVELNDYVIGAYGVAVVVNTNNPVGTLTTNQVRDIFTGVIQNWKDVGGPDAPIHLYVRDPISGTYLGFRELAMENKPYAQPQMVFTNYGAIVQAVAADSSGIGYTSLGMAKGSGAKPVSISGVEASTDAVNKHEYPYARVIHLYTSKKQEPATALDFIQFVQSPKGQEVIEQVGFVPHS
ncbi:MAG TPA: phosphate ABC transporter substrate-binding protein [Verrucomicrobiae bacterium]|nr:phosphate ABC transporter substrate-binding protein [Verrucomicrobiae bacterium]